MAMERWIAIASLGLFAMFAGEMISIYHFMQDAPEDLEFGFVFDADPKILQFISIGVAPASIMAAVSFIMSRRYGSKQIGTLIILGGVVLLVGMIYCLILIDTVDDAYITDAVKFTPLLFIIVSFPVMVFGGLLFRKIDRKKPKKDYLQ